MECPHCHLEAQIRADGICQACGRNRWEPTPESGATAVNPKPNAQLGRDGVAATAIPECEELIELATPHIYRRNLFRVLGLPVNASPKDVQQQQNRRKIQEKLGIAASAHHGGPLVLEPPPTEEDIRAAMERLNRPVDRLLDELFWFWPTNGSVAGDPALKAVEQGNVDKAAKLWTEQAELGGQREIATHNLAVLDHLIALDYEARLASQSLDTKEQEPLADLWLRVFVRWGEVLDGEEFWSVVKNRVRDLDDAQLTTGFVRRVRGTLPTALLLINAKIAYSAAERSDSELARQHYQLLQLADFRCGLADEAIRESLKPIRNRIKTATDNAKGRWTRTPHHGNRFARELHEQAKSMLAIVDAILPENDLTRAGLHDLVAETMREGLVDFGNKTNDWQECDRILKLAEELAIGQAVKTKLSNDRAIVQQNAKDGNDWCSPGYWDLPEETITQLEAARAKTQAGDYEGAGRLLVVLDPKIGKPLRCCLAFCLSHRGSQIAGQGLNDFSSEPTPKVQRFLDVIGRLGSVPLPNPNMQSWQLPDCPCCGTKSYTSWVNGEYKGQRYWMCSQCSEEDNREREKRKRVLRKSISESLEYVLLADELDPNNTGIRENLKSLKEIANDIGASIPKTKGLKEKLGAETTRGKRHEFESSPEDTVCHFCGEHAADESCRITVAMCGDLQPAELLFCKGTEYEYGDAIVPRCKRCFGAHREVAEAQTAIEQAESIGKECDRCKSSLFWHRCLCRRCDSRVFQLGRLSKGFAFAAAIFLPAVGLALATDYYEVLASVADFVAANSGLTLTDAGFWVRVIVGGAIPLFMVLSVPVGLKRRQRCLRREMSEKRQAEIQQRRHVAHNIAQKKLDEAASFLRSAGIKSESAYLEFHRINELCGRGWRFGHVTEANGKAAIEDLDYVKGLVSGVRRASEGSIVEIAALKTAISEMRCWDDNLETLSRRAVQALVLRGFSPKDARRQLEGAGVSRRAARSLVREAASDNAQFSQEGTSHNP